jgi:hypothetical protein
MILQCRPVDVRGTLYYKCYKSTDVYLFVLLTVYLLELVFRQCDIITNSCLNLSPFAAKDTSKAWLTKCGAEFSCKEEASDGKTLQG